MRAAPAQNTPRTLARTRAAPQQQPLALDEVAEPASLAAEPPPPGSVRRIELMEPPATHYASPPQHDEAGLNYTTVLAELRARGAEYDPLLGRAAREVAFQHSFYDGTLPRAVLQFLLRSAGALDRSVLEGFTATNAKGPGAIRERALQLVERALQDARGAPIRVGVGEAFVPGAQYPRFIAVLVSRRTVELDPTPARVRLGETWLLRGRLPPSTQRPSALILTPNGMLRTVAVATVGQTFTLSLPVSEAGRYEVSVSATGPFGPSPLLQLPLYVDASPPTYLDVRTPDAESDVFSEADAAARAHQLLNQYRARHRKAALPRDPALDAIARAHARDMREARFFGHRSPSTGDLGDRLSAARYRALYSSENLARAQTLGEATDGLYESLGHRRNLLSEAPTLVGLAAVLAEPKSKTTEPRSPPRDWFVVQVFAKAP